MSRTARPLQSKVAITAAVLAVHLAVVAAGRSFLSQSQKVINLREMLRSPQLITMPCCYDGLTAKLVEEAGFPLTFMTGFGSAAVHGLPDTGLISSDQMVQNVMTISASLQSIPLIADGDTGFAGNEVNVRHTVQRYAMAGAAGIMIEDQLSPKRCGHTKGKSIVSRDEAYRRIKAAVDARNEGLDIVILARTDARAILGIDEAIERCRMFRVLGADWTFLEAPESEDEMRLYCHSVSGPKLANMLEGGKTPILPPSQLQEIGYTVAAYPLTLLSSAVKAQKKALRLLSLGQQTDHLLLPFEELQKVVGFMEYDDTLRRYSSPPSTPGDR